MHRPIEALDIGLLILLIRPSHPVPLAVGQDLVCEGLPQMASKEGL